MGILNRRVSLLIAAMLVGIAGCAPTHANLPEGLPTTIGGVAMVYDVHSGSELAHDSYAVDIAAALGVPIDRLTKATGYRDILGTYNSDIYQVRGADTKLLLEAAISSSVFKGIRRTDTMAGKSVTRATTPGGGLPLDKAPYFYAYDDIVIIFVGDPRLIEEGLRALP